MNKREEMTRARYEAKGYEVIKAGLPDLVLLKDGQISFVEVKSDVDKFLKSQIRAIGLLKKHGFNVAVERVTILFGSTRSDSDSKKGFGSIQKDGRFVIPKKLMIDLGWRVGDKIALEIEDGKLIVENLEHSIRPLEERLK